MKPPRRAVRVGYNPDFTPFTFSENGEPRGLLIERIALVFADAGVPLSLRAVALPNLFSELAADNIDMLAAIASIPQRQGVSARSRPIAMSGGAWFTTAGTDWPRDAELRGQDLPTRRVITPASGPLVAVIREQFPLLRLQTSSDYAAALQSVLTGDADAAALNWQVGTLMCERDHPALFRNPDTPFCRLPLVMATAPGDPLGLLPLLDPCIRDEWELHELAATVSE